MKVNSESGECPPRVPRRVRRLFWPDLEHRGYVNLGKTEPSNSRTLYGRHLPSGALAAVTKVGQRKQTKYQLIIVAGELDDSLMLTDCILICDSIGAGQSLSNFDESIINASGNARMSLNSGIAVVNGRCDLSSETTMPIYTRDDIYLVSHKMSPKDLEKQKSLHKNNPYAEGKIANTGLTFFQLADLGIACKLDSDKPVVVESVKTGSPADVGKIKVGDTIKRVNSRPVKALGKVEELFRYAMMDGPKAKVAIGRGKESVDLEIHFP